MLATGTDAESTVTLTVPNTDVLTCARTVVLPGANAVTVPVGETDATLTADEVQVTETADINAPPASRTCAASANVAPAPNRV
jgi:hypothetical protein